MICLGLDLKHSDFFWDTFDQILKQSANLSIWKIKKALISVQTDHVNP